MAIEDAGQCVAAGEADHNEIVLVGLLSALHRENTESRWQV